MFKESKQLRKIEFVELKGLNKEVKLVSDSVTLSCHRGLLCQ